MDGLIKFGLAFSMIMGIWICMKIVTSVIEFGFDMLGEWFVPLAFSVGFGIMVVWT